MSGSFVVFQLICKLEDSLSQLSVEQFLRLYKAFLIWPTSVSERSFVYFKDYWYLLVIYVEIQFTWILDSHPLFTNGGYIHTFSVDAWATMLHSSFDLKGISGTVAVSSYPFGSYLTCYVYRTFPTAISQASWFNVQNISKEIFLIIILYCTYLFCAIWTICRLHRIGYSNL